MKNIHLVPTDQPSRLYLDSENNFNITDVEMKSGVKKHICITSDETIKEGDWVVTNGGLRFVTSINNDKSKTFTDDGSISKKSPSPYCDLEYYKKIILTTDQDLIKDGVQPIDDEFLEWFVKNPSCEEVEVETKQHFEADKSKRRNPLNGVYYSYKIIIPQEEPKQEWKPKEGEEVWIKVFSNWSSGKYIGYDVDKKTHLVRETEEGGGHLFISSHILPYSVLPNEPKQETLEEAAERLSELQEGTYTIQHKTTYQHGFIDGAKYQAERMYSEEEVIELIKKAVYQKQNAWKVGELDKWFEQFSKLKNG